MTVRNRDFSFSPTNKPKGVGDWAEAGNRLAERACIFPSFTATLRMNELQLLSLATGLAVRDTLEELLDVSATLKWPNDVLWRGRKLAAFSAKPLLSLTEYIMQ